MFVNLADPIDFSCPSTVYFHNLSRLVVRRLMLGQIVILVGLDADLATPFVVRPTHDTEKLGLSCA